MQNSSQERDSEILLSHYKTIQFKACTLSLYDRSSQGKTIGIRSQSMLPQITISAKTLQALAQLSSSSRTGIYPTSKLSPSHYLSLSGDNCYWPEVLTQPPCDFLIYLRPTGIQKLADHLYHDEKMLDFFYQHLEKNLFHNHAKIEVLDLCRCLILFSKDKRLNRFFIRCEILFPYTSLLFIPLSNHKLVSCPLTKKLIQKDVEYDRGYLTMDQASRIVPLEIGDSMVVKYPIIGIWVKGIPQTNSAVKAVNLVHPLVWSACIQFILNKDFREKVSPNPNTCSFLFIDFSDKVKFYEVSCQKPPSWKTTSYSSEFPASPDRLQPIQVQFLKKDTRFLIKNSISTMHESQVSQNSRATTPPTAKPPVHKIQRTAGSAKEIYRTKSYEKIIGEQTKLIEKLQAKVQKLQLQVSPKSRSYTENSDHSDSFKNSIETNTTVSVQQYKIRSHKKINFDLDEKIGTDRKVVYGSQKINKPMSSQPVPAIKYCSSSESSEDENVKAVQKAYLNNNRK